MDNLAEKLDGCPLNQVLFEYNSDCENCPLYWVPGCPLFRGIEVNGRTVRTFRIVRYIMGVSCWGVSIKRGSTVVHKINLVYFFHYHRSTSSASSTALNAMADVRDKGWSFHHHCPLFTLFWNELFNMNFSSNIFTVTSAMLTFLLVDVPIYKNFSSKLSSGNWLSVAQAGQFLFTLWYWTPLKSRLHVVQSVGLELWSKDIMHGLLRDVRGKTPDELTDNKLTNLSTLLPLVE